MVGMRSISLKKTQEFEVIGSHISDPLGVLQNIEMELEPNTENNQIVQNIIIEVPNIEPVRRVLLRSKEKEDGVFATITCDWMRGEDPVLYNQEMSKFFRRN